MGIHFANNGGCAYSAVWRLHLSLLSRISMRMGHCRDPEALAADAEGKAFPTVVLLQSISP